MSEQETTTMTDNMISDVKQASIVATVVTLIITLIELPILWVYLFTKWLFAFIGACLGMWMVRLVVWAWKRYISK
jgi:hypothetical protein